MGEFLQTLITILEYAWPFRPVEQWEKGVYYVLGRAKKVVGPGRWPVIPFFMDVIEVSIVPAPLRTPLLNVSLKDGRVCSFSAQAVVQVTDASAALNNVNDYQESTQELLGSIVADRLSRAEAGKVDPENRTELLRTLKQALERETLPFGVAIRAMRFTNFVIMPKAYRFLTDTALDASGW